MMIVAIAPSVLWPPEERPADRPVGDTAATPPAATDPTPAPAPPPPTFVPAPPAGPARTPSDTVWVTSPLYRFGFDTRGAALVAAELREYESFAPGDSSLAVQLVPPGRPFLEHQVVVGGDTVHFADWDFTPSVHDLTVTDGTARLSFSATRGPARITLAYVFEPDDYVFTVEGAAERLSAGGSVLVVDLGDGLRSVEVDSAGDYREYAVVTKATKTERHRFSSLDPGEADTLSGPFEWVGFKSKYFLFAALAVDEGHPQFGGAFTAGGPKPGKFHTRTRVALTLPVPPGGSFRYEIYAGPLQYRRLAAVGHQLDDANPYGWIFRPIIQPVSVGVVYVLLWMHERLNLAYGWVLIVFGMALRLLLWPLNQKAMESGIRMQAVAPLIKETQERYKKDPERLQREMMRIYRDHKVNPLGGCLPMLLPMPVLFALFFVFANTIEFRGVPFLWIPDLARPDPLYLVPIAMGVSMYGVSKVGQMGMPPSPQMKMMLYFMPIMMTALFFNFASGLNLYYAAQNIFSLPQQYLIARRRLREAPVAKPAAR
jgi:YidC/Oxa1 family membrane protein insertase